MQRIPTALVRTELERKQRILAPRNVRIHMYLVLQLGQMREALATHRAQVHLRPGGQMHRPELIRTGHLGVADELIGRAAQIVVAMLVAQRPTAGRVLGDADLEAAAGVALLGLAQHVAERVHGQILAEMRAQVDNACNGIVAIR